MKVGTWLELKATLFVTKINSTCIGFFIAGDFLMRTLHTGIDFSYFGLFPWLHQGELTSPQYSRI